MSVIAGVWSFDGKLSVASTCHDMLHALRPYSHADATQYSSPSLAMGHGLLPLLPEDSFDHQPLAAHGITAMVADVRLDNRQQLLQELNISTQQSATLADSDLLLAAYQRWAETCVDHLSGAFVFAVWHEQEQHLFLARDHTGERPLFYAATSGSFAFASMPRGLQALPTIPAVIDEDYIARYLTLANISVERTVFLHMLRLPAGCALSVRRGALKLWRHWQTDRLSDLRLATPPAYLEAFRAVFDEAVQARLRTRGAVGAQLSGGLDSGAVAATAAHLLAREHRRLTCFTAVPRPGMEGPGDEGAAAADVAALYPNIDHVLVESSDTSFLDILDHNNNLYDHPCFGPSNEVWSNAIFDRARQAGITVLLNGNSGNATFSADGMQALSKWFRSGQWSTLARMAQQLVSTGSASPRALLRHALGPSLPLWVRRLGDPHLRGFSLDYSMLHPEIAQHLDLERVAFRDLNQTSPDGRTQLRMLLEYGDIADTPIAAQGGWQMDYRDPTYDRRVVEFCLTVPLEEFLRDGQRRSLARRAMEGRLPKSTLQRVQRGSQSADWYLSMAAVRDRMLAELQSLQASPLAARLLDLQRMRHLIENWPTSGFEGLDVNRSHHIAITRGFSVGRFLMKYDPALSRI